MLGKRDGEVGIPTPETPPVEQKSEQKSDDSGNVKDDLPF